MINRLGDWLIFEVLEDEYLSGIIFLLLKSFKMDKIVILYMFYVLGLNNNCKDHSIKNEW